MAGELVFPSPASYTELDHAALDARLRELFGSLYPKIDLSSQAEFTRLIIGAFANIGDRLAYLINRLARESRILTATQRRMLIGLVKLIGYRPPGATAATADLVFTLAAPHGEDIPIPVDTIVKTKDRDNPVRFRTLFAGVILAGATTITLTGEHSVAESDAWLSNERANQEFQLSRSPYVDNSLVITTPAGLWTEVGNFLASRGTDRHFMTIIDAQDRATVRFGDGRNGAIPLGPITGDYKTGGGIAGRLLEGALEVIESTIVDASGVPVTAITVTNPSKTSGGDDRQSNALIKLLAPESIRVIGAVRCREDYEIVARAVPGAARALMLTRRQDPSVLPNEGFLYVVPTGGTDPSEALLEAIARQFGDEVYVGGAANPLRFPRGPHPKETTFQLRVRGASYAPINVLTKVNLRSGFSAAAVKGNIMSALQSFFAPMVDIRTLDPTTELTGEVPNPRLDFGFNLKDKDGNPSPFLSWSTLLNVVIDATGVLDVDPGVDGFLLNDVRNNVSLELRSFPKLGNVTIINAANGQIIP